VLDLHDVAVTTPTAIVGAQAAPAQPQVPVTAHLAGRTVSQVVLGGYPFLDFQPLAVNAAAGFAPSRLLSMSMSGPVSVFGAAGSAVMNATTDLSRRPAGQAQDGPASAQPPMEFAGRVPVMDVPLVARSMGVNVPLGAFAAQLKAARVAYPASPARRAAAAAAGDGAGSGDAGLDVNAELQTCGMSSLVSFAMSGQAGGSFTATFIPFQINRVCCLLCGVCGLSCGAEVCSGGAWRPVLLRLLWLTQAPLCTASFDTYTGAGAQHPGRHHCRAGVRTQGCHSSARSSWQACGPGGGAACCTGTAVRGAAACCSSECSVRGSKATGARRVSKHVCTSTSGMPTRGSLTAPRLLSRAHAGTF
jgi:hypothetical protein